MATVGARQQQINEADDMTCQGCHFPRSTISTAQMAEVRGLLRIKPDDRELKIRMQRESGDMPDADGQWRPDTIPIWYAQVKAGLRLPPSPFLVGICERFGIPFFQISPSSLRRAHILHILCAANNYPHSVELFHQTHILKKTDCHYNFTAKPKMNLTFLGNLHSMDKKFRDKYFFVQVRNGTWADCAGTDEVEWHRTKHSSPPNRKPLGDLEIAFIDLLGQAFAAKDFDVLKLVASPSVLAGAGLFSRYPPTSIGMWRSAEHGTIASFSFLPDPVVGGDTTPQTGSAQHVSPESFNLGRPRPGSSAADIQPLRLHDEGDASSAEGTRKRRKTRQVVSSKKKKVPASGAESKDSFEALLDDVPRQAAPAREGSDSVMEIPGPRALKDLTGQECRSQMESQIASVDLRRYDVMNMGDLAFDMCLGVEQLRVKCLSASRHMTRAAADLHEKEGELMASLADNTELREQLRQAQAELSQMKVKKESLETELARVSQSKEEELKALKHEMSEECRAKLNQMKTTIADQENQAFMRGIQEFRQQYFLTARGQLFLRYMLEDSLQAFRRSPDMLLLMGPAMQFLVKEGSRLALDQVGATPDQRSKFDFEAVLKQVDDTSLNGLLGVDPSAPSTPGWWLPILDKALQLFARDETRDALPAAPVIRSPYLNELRCHMRSPRGNYPGGNLVYPPPTSSSVVPDSQGQKGSSSRAAQGGTEVVVAEAAQEEVVFQLPVVTDPVIEEIAQPAFVEDPPVEEFIVDPPSSPQRLD
ncbi:uncharacterized protein LOC130998389 [Salvia miltiorrhiza]|uniref:uncharacterized protein LOC130998389 n=1 Tax=Salvia miltiorrhiza TaxID=226208 RepID=UPI0025AD3226|nr:uncharacterized protein LOC130998389 [Salvia miltiorrhiza]